MRFRAEDFGIQVIRETVEARCKRRRLSTDADLGRAIQTAGERARFRDFGLLG